MRSQEESKRIVASLMEKVISGEISRDRLKNDAFAFDNEMEAMYFSNCRRFLQSKNAHMVMEYKNNNDRRLLGASE